MLMNVKFKQISCMMCLMLARTAHATGVDELAWSHETWNDSCTLLKFDFPVSLVPVEYTGNPSIQPNWQSFDGNFFFNIEDRPIQLELTSLKKNGFLSWTACKKQADAESCLENGNKTVYSSKSQVNKFINSPIKNPYCGTVIATAPDRTNMSRFGIKFDLCGPNSERKLLRDAVERLWKSLDFRYAGCCAKDINNEGCLGRK